MNKEEYRAAINDVIYLAACAVNKDIPDIKRIESMDLDNVYKATSTHLLAGIAAAALKNAGVRDERFAQASGKAIRKTLLIQADKDEVLQKLEEAGIWYMPLKGSVLLGLYPAVGMREMADCDILFDSSRSEDVRTIMEDLGFSTEKYGRGNHDVYYKKPVSNFEMHRELFEALYDVNIYEYYRNIKRKLIQDEKSRYGYHFSKEDAYIYMIVHEFKHYSQSGTGLRSLLDTYVYCTAQGNLMNWEYVEKELESLGVAEFEHKNRALAFHLFSPQKCKEEQSEQIQWAEAFTLEENKMLEYIIGSGTYGIFDNSVRNKINSFGGGKIGRLRYYISRIFLPLEIVRSYYPFVYKHRILLLFLPFFRLGRFLLFRRDRMRKEFEAIRKSK